MWRIIKGVFPDTLVAIDNVKITLVHGWGSSPHTHDMGMEKAVVFKAFFASVFSTDQRPRGSQCPQLKDHDCKNDQLPSDPEVVGYQLLQGLMELTQKSWKRWLMSLQNLSMSFGHSWKSREIPADWKLANIVPAFKKGSCPGMTTVTPGVSVSLQCLVELWRRLFWEVLK